MSWLRLVALAGLSAGTLIATPPARGEMMTLGEEGTALRFTLDLAQLHPRGPYGGGISLDFALKDPFETPRDRIGFVYRADGLALFEAEFGQEEVWHNPSGAIFILADRLPNATVSVDIFAKSGAFMIDVETVSFILLDPSGQPIFDVPVRFDGPCERPDGALLLESRLNRALSAG